MQQAPSPAPTPVPSPAPTPAATEGRAVFTITDAAADMKAVTSVKVTVDSVQVHSATEGWVKVSSEQKTYDLLELKAKGTQALLADVKLKPGTYQQVRLDISKVVVVDASEEHEAKLPSGELKIVGELVVKEGSTSTATFDFIADESLHVTGKGEYILAPVVQLETKEDATAEVKSDTDVKISGGKTHASVKVGMDIAGNIAPGLMIAQDEVLSVEAGKIKVGGKGRVVLGITDAAADMGAVTSVKVTVDKAEVHSASEGWVTVMSEAKTYDLLELKAKGMTSLLADVQVKEGSYEQLRLTVSKATVVDASGEHEAKLPAGELKLVGKFEVKADATATAVFDFIANESLHVTGKGEYILAPVIQIETKDQADVEVKDEAVTVKTGRSRTSAKVGMDADGNVGVGTKIDTENELMIENGKINVGARMKAKVEINATY